MTVELFLLAGFVLALIAGYAIGFWAGREVGREDAGALHRARLAALSQATRPRSSHQGAR